MFPVARVRTARTGGYHGLGRAKEPVADVEVVNLQVHGDAAGQVRAAKQVGPGGPGLPARSQRGDRSAEVATGNEVAQGDVLGPETKDVGDHYRALGARGGINY